MVARRDYSATTDRAIFALRAIGWTTAEIASAFDRSPIALETHIGRLKKSGYEAPFKNLTPVARRRPEDDPIPGEVWTDLPARGLSVSSHDRVISICSGYLRSPYRQSWNGEPGVNFETSTRRSTVTIAQLQREARGEPEPPKANAFTSEEDALIRSAKSACEARARLPHRPSGSISGRASRIGVKFERPQQWAPDEQLKEARGVADTDAAAKAVKSYPSDIRGDLLSQVVWMQLEGFEGTADEAAKIAFRQHFRMFNSFRDISFDAPARGTDDLRLCDVIASDHPHF